MNKPVHASRGFTLVETLVAMLLATVVLGIITTLLIRTHEIFRHVDTTETFERTVRDFDEQFRNVIESSVSIRQLTNRVADTSYPGGGYWQNIRVDYYDDANGCLAFEVTKLNGKPVPTYPSNVDYFTWRTGRYATVAGKSTCVKQPSTTTPSWSSTRWGLEPPKFTLFDIAGMPVPTTTAGWDQPWYTNIRRISYVRSGRDHGSGITSGANLPSSVIAPQYGS